MAAVVVGPCQVKAEVSSLAEFLPEMMVQPLWHLHSSVCLALALVPTSSTSVHHAKLPPALGSMFAVDVVLSGLDTKAPPAQTPCHLQDFSSQQLWAVLEEHALLLPSLGGLALALG